MIYDSPMTGGRRNYSYAELRDEVARFAGALAAWACAPATGWSIYLPMIPEAVIAMLACARIGAVHSVVFGGFAAKELAARIDDAEPVLVTASGGWSPETGALPADRARRAAIALVRPAGEAAMHCRHLHTPWLARRLSAERPWLDGRVAGEPADRCRSRRPIPSISSIPPAPPESPRAWCATTAATQSHWAGRCAISTTWPPAR